MLAFLYSMCFKKIFMVDGGGENKVFKFEWSFFYILKLAMTTKLAFPSLGPSHMIQRLLE